MFSYRCLQYNSVTKIKMKHFLDNVVNGNIKYFHLWCNCDTEGVYPATIMSLIIASWNNARSVLTLIVLPTAIQNSFTTLLQENPEMSVAFAAIKTLLNDLDTHECKYMQCYHTR